MVKTKSTAIELGGGNYSRRQLQEMFRQGRQAFEQHRAEAPVAEAVRYEADRRRVVIQLSNQCEMSLPIGYFSEISGATPADLSEVTILPEGLAIEWPGLDQQYLVSWLLLQLGAAEMRCCDKTS